MDAARKLAQAISNAILNPLIGLFFITALFLFIYGAVRYLRTESGSADRTTGKRHMIWGILGMVAMFSVYSILAILLRSAGVTPNDLGPIQGQIPL